MKVVILAGGHGTRLAEETDLRPKPMVEIGGMPILWHIMKYYAHFGFREFFLALGYKGEIIKRFYLDYCELQTDLRVELATGVVHVAGQPREDWTVHMVDTGRDTATGGRIKRLQRALAGETFMVTYGDGVSNVDLDALLRFHRAHGRMATVTAVRPPSRFGGLLMNGDRVEVFIEKPQLGEGWINGGFMVFEPGVLDHLQGDDDTLEIDVLSRLAADGQLCAYRHDGFWQCMDTLRDKRLLEQIWDEHRAAWKVWA
jgi:glucose-1-phosphate cytidylyltransferase